MIVQEPRHTRLELRFRLFGVPVRVGLLFWLSSAAFGVRHYADPETGNIAWFGFWMAAVLAAVLIHELGHVCAGRLFGMRGQVVLYGLGGLTLGIDELPRRWQRILVLLAGPLAGLLVVATVWGVTYLSLPAAWGPETLRMIGNGMEMVFLINFYWTIFNLLPLWPLVGGRLACEIGEGLFGPAGTKIALILCLATTALLTLLAAVLLSGRLNVHFDVPRHVEQWLRNAQLYRLWLLQYGFFILYCYLLWIRTFRALWPLR